MIPHPDQRQPHPNHLQRPHWGLPGQVRHHLRGGLDPWGERCKIVNFCWWETFDATSAEQYQRLNLFWPIYAGEKNTIHNLIFSDNVCSQILSVGPNFKYASNFLWPFKLNTPSGGWRKKVNHFVERVSLPSCLSPNVLMANILGLPLFRCKTVGIQTSQFGVGCLISYACMVAYFHFLSLSVL